MGKIRFALIGGGWRAEFYARIARAMPNLFEVTGVLLRSAQKEAYWADEYRVPAFCTLDALVGTRPDFYVLCIGKPDIADFLCEMMRRGLPVLCETPPAVTEENLHTIWQLSRQTQTPVLVAEQYFHQPFYACWAEAIRRGMIGEVSNLSVSAVHEYHAVSLIRRFLQTGFENATLCGKRFHFPVRKTDSRQGMCIDGTSTSAQRDVLTFEFESGRVAFFDFSPVQYHSYIRTRHFSVQGDRGEIDDLCIRTINAQNEPAVGVQQRLDLGVYNNLEWSHFGIAVNGEFLYKSPFPKARINDDEIAVAACVEDMGQCLHTGKTAYPLREALQDAYIALCMEQALTHPYEAVRTKTQPWAVE